MKITLIQLIPENNVECLVLTLAGRKRLIEAVGLDPVSVLELFLYFGPVSILLF